MDGFRNTIHAKLTSDPGGTDYTDTTYDGLERVQSVSNPYRSTSDLTYATTTYGYDPLGRKVGQTQTDGSTSSWSYPNNVVIFTDANSIVSERASDGLGRLTGVLEPNASGLSANSQTTYTYNALDNLTGVTQSGALAGEQPRVRNFTYDSLGRLVTASNPETGTVCYGAWTNSVCSNGYDANGNLTAKTDARNVTMTYKYDVLNRLLSKFDGSVSSCYQYDTGAANGSGTAEWTQSGTCAATVPVSGAITLRSITAYDEEGRIKSEQQCIVGNCTTSSVAQLWYGYDLAGEPTCLINSAGTSQTGLSLSGGTACTSGAVGTPSGLLLTTGYDAAGHINSVTSNWTAYPTNIYSMQTGGYGPVGPLNWKLGPNLSVTEDYTKRLWVNSFAATRVTQ
jgi:YD repeat-containing protein